jgi:hypothetical protein
LPLTHLSPPSSPCFPAPCPRRRRTPVSRPPGWPGVAAKPKPPVRPQFSPTHSSLAPRADATRPAWHAAERCCHIVSRPSGPLPRRSTTPEPPPPPPLPIKGTARPYERR